ncbi:hypothetical protein OS493_025963 [Desmophyllum pertusum]|uniref:Uncharacterized protein n=1 Tax=Desmophyllum pertusum TaxID=174260 RepID=A0A9X0CKM1_9CNID|nr:hypothetical protein OS493_025963 [Desmophyllum pertusum]
MKNFVFLLSILLLVMHVRAQKGQPHDFIYKAAAQICKPYFAQCAQNRQIRECFQDVYKTCLPTYQKRLQSIENCAAEAGDDLEAVLNCYQGSAHEA